MEVLIGLCRGGEEVLRGGGGGLAFRNGLDPIKRNHPPSPLPPPPSSLPP